MGDFPFACYQVLRDGPNQSHNSQVRDYGAEKGADKTALVSGQIVCAFDKTKWVQGGMYDKGEHIYNLWIRIHDFRFATLPGLKLPLPEKPTLPASPWFDPKYFLPQATWELDYLQRNLLDNNKWLWIDSRNLKMVAPPTPLPVIPGGIAVAVLSPVRMRKSPSLTGEIVRNPDGTELLLPVGYPLAVVDTYTDLSGCWALVDENAGYWVAWKVLLKQYLSRRF